MLRCYDLKCIKYMHFSEATVFPQNLGEEMAFIWYLAERNTFLGTTDVYL